MGVECLENFLQHSEGRMVDVWQHRRQNPKKMASKKIEKKNISEVKMIEKLFFILKSFCCVWDTR